MVLQPGQLTIGQTRKIIDNDLCFLDEHGEIIARYKIGPFGQYWPTGDIESNPPKGFCRITNQYWDPVNQKVVVEFDNVPK